MVTTKSQSREPHNITQAVNDSQWRDAMNEEYYALIRNDTWELVSPRPTQNIVGCK